MKYLTLIMALIASLNSYAYGDVYTDGDIIVEHRSDIWDQNPHGTSVFDKAGETAANMNTLAQQAKEAQLAEQQIEYMKLKNEELRRELQRQQNH